MRYLRGFGDLGVLVFLTSRLWVQASGSVEGRSNALNPEPWLHWGLQHLGVSEDWGAFLGGGGP